jgi:hypothetical protein
MNMRLPLFLSAAIATLLALGLADCNAEDAANYPSQTIKIIVPFPAGGTADIEAQSAKMAEGTAIVQFVGPAIGPTENPTSALHFVKEHQQADSSEPKIGHRATAHLPQCKAANGG